MRSKTYAGVHPGTVERRVETGFGPWAGREGRMLLWQKSLRRWGPAPAIVLALVLLGLGCAGDMQTVQDDVQAVRRAVHQKCHSEYNSCRQAAGASRGRQDACQRELDSCLAAPATD